MCMMSSKNPPNRFCIKNLWNVLRMPLNLIVKNEINIFNLILRHSIPNYIRCPVKRLTYQSWACQVIKLLLYPQDIKKLKIPLGFLSFQTPICLYRAFLKRWHSIWMRLLSKWLSKLESNWRTQIIQFLYFHKTIRTLQMVTLSVLFFLISFQKSLRSCVSWKGAQL